ncbi:MAG TPA: alpha/beta hydrolase-fold protein, partial [Gemmatimonas sp.]|nr:alpha/beta hydrolase-fold protein [Gemmatimonas sp.]
MTLVSAPSSLPVSRSIRITYPAAQGQIGLRTETDWERSLRPVRVEANTSWFDVPFTTPMLAMKPVLERDSTVHWAKGPNSVVSAYEPSPALWPYFFADEHGRFSGIDHVAWEGGTLAVRTYVPAGYDENTLHRYPVLYMQDGQNLFFPDEAFHGNEWRVDETMDQLDRMNAVHETIVVGIAPVDRMRDYTYPGYAAYGRAVAQRLKPRVDAEVRTRSGARHTAVMGSSLGGVASLYLAWEYPTLFGMAGCLSSSFGIMDDLFARVAAEPRRDIVVYLDSGWPRDNFDATNAMRDLLVERGYRLGVDLLQFSFPDGTHREDSWAARLHLPFQFFF